ncbi:FMN-binding negative transcriptional regulator [Aestuariibius sp. 2305UL40-4]|uniref:FMN-binding negative transcriptional regulator n=1 Tax=Aestuariibius violaceus TaxID=3234132 RepID=UPI00345E95F5
MHPNPAFRKAETGQNLAFARSRAFGTLAINAEGGPLISHVPFLIAPDGRSADLHLVRSNPILRQLAAPQPAVIAVTGPDGYISPDWYGVDDQVPTWNYIAVHLRGQLSTLDAGDMRDMLDRQSAAYEDRLPKHPWTTGKMTPDVLNRMMRQIVPCRMAIEKIDGTWKLGQNKPDEVRGAAAGHLTDSSIGSELDALAGLMRDPPA